jgi:hypothetical protein
MMDFEADWRGSRLKFLANSFDAWLESRLIDVGQALLLWLRRQLFLTALEEPPRSWWRGVLMGWAWALCGPVHTAAELEWSWKWLPVAEAITRLASACERAAMGWAEAWGLEL